MGLMDTHVFHQHRAEHSPPLLPLHHCTAPELKPIGEHRLSFSKAKWLLRANWGVSPSCSRCDRQVGEVETLELCLHGRRGVPRAPARPHREEQLWTHPGQSWLFPGGG